MRALTFDILVCLVLLLTGAVGFFLGRSAVKIEEKTVVEYKEMPTVSVSVVPEVSQWSVPELPIWLWHTDTLTGVQIVDTAAILADWIVKREYNGNTGNDSIGYVSWHAEVRYNQMQTMNLDFKPRQRSVTTTKTVERLFIPFVMAGFNTAGYGSIGAGAFVFYLV